MPPLLVVRAWLDGAWIIEGRVFRSMTRHGRLLDTMSDEAVALVVQRRAKMAGMDPAGLSAHSLRAALATSGAAAGAEHTMQALLRLRASDRPGVRPGRRTD